jgi:hypothetical protein
MPKSNKSKKSQLAKKAQLAKMSGGNMPLSWILDGSMWGNYSNYSYQDSWFLQHDILNSTIYPNNYMYSSSYSYVPTEYSIENFITHDLPIATWIGDSLYNAVYNNYPIGHFYSYYDYLLSSNILSNSYDTIEVNIGNSGSSNSSNSSNDALDRLKAVIKHIFVNILKDRNVNSSKNDIQQYFKDDQVAINLTKAINETNIKFNDVVKEYAKYLGSSTNTTSANLPKNKELLKLIGNILNNDNPIQQVFSKQLANNKKNR